MSSLPLSLLIYKYQYKKYSVQHNADSNHRKVKDVCIFKSKNTDFLPFLCFKSAIYLFTKNMKNFHIKKITYDPGS